MARRNSGSERTVFTDRYSKQIPIETTYYMALGMEFPQTGRVMQKIDS
jgi:hypothetical protein